MRFYVRRMVRTMHASRSRACSSLSEKKCGSLQRLPRVHPAEEQLASAKKRTRKATSTRGMKRSQIVDEHTKGLAVPLRDYVRSFPKPESLHPFESALLELTVGCASYKQAVQDVDQLRKALLEVGKARAHQLAKGKNQKDSEKDFADALEELERLFLKNASKVDRLKDMAKALRKLPIMDEELPTLVLVGAPNVGKSSLVRELSSGVPEVCNYPFTTRNIHMGHFFVGGVRHQVTDTPGVLHRPDEERNRMERLTLASMEYLPTAVLFVMDPTEECGTSWEDQQKIRVHLQQRFHHRPWLNVVSKIDELDTATRLAMHEWSHEEGQKETVLVSSKTLEGLEELKKGAMRMLAGNGEIMDGSWETNKHAAYN